MGSPPLYRSAKPSRSITRRRLRAELLEARHLLTVDVNLGVCFPEQANSQALSQSLETTGFTTTAVEAGGGLVEFETEDRPDHSDHAFEMVDRGYGRLDAKDDPSLAPNSTGRAAPNLRVTNTRILRDANNVLVDSIPVGQLVAIQVNFVTEGIPAGSTFAIRFEMDGIPLFWNNIDWATGNGTWFAWYSGWYAGPGNHDLEVYLDEFNQVAETDEADNSFQQSFSPYVPVDLPQQLIFPTAFTRNESFAVNNYADVDPRQNSRADFAGGIFQYDGHNAWDLGPMNFAAQDAGFPIVAAADGVVSQAVDGNFDRKTNWDNTPANYVIIDHGNNWNTIYWHLARDSVTVVPGQVVKAGDVIGEMGSSGISTGTHLHFTLRRFGFPVETMFDTATYFRPEVDVAYQPDTEPGGVYSSIANDNSPHPSDWREGFPRKDVFSTALAEPVVFNFGISHLGDGERIDVEFNRPDGTTAFTSNWTSNGITRFPQFYWWIGASAWGSQLGTWTAQVLHEGSVLIAENFEVVSGAAPAQIRVVDGIGDNVNPGRTTPFDFGSSTGSVRSFLIQNHGNSTLEVGDWELPLGFGSVTSLPSTIAPGSSASFDVRFDNAFNSKSFGAVRFTTNDPDLPEFWFNVEGTTTAGAPPGTALMSRIGTDVAFQIGAPVATLADDAFYSSQGTVPASVVVKWEGGRRVGDQLLIENQGSGTGQISLSGTDVFYEGTLIGQQVGNGSAPEDLQVDVVAGVSDEAVIALLRAIQFGSTSNIAGPRFVRWFVEDSTGTHSTHAYNAVRVHDPIYELATVDSVLVNDGSAQRSRVESLQVTFNQEVTLLPDAFEVFDRDGSGGPVDVFVSSTNQNGQTIATVTFGGALFVDGSLVDGNYLLRILGDRVIGLNNQALDGDGNGIRGGDLEFGADDADNFFRYYGDSDGDRTIGFVDFVAFRNTFGSSSGDANYDRAFDLDDDETIGFSDFVAFRNRFGSAL